MVQELVSDGCLFKFSRLLPRTQTRTREPTTSDDGRQRQQRSESLNIVPATMFVSLPILI
jgi:hypothetical protein